MGKITPEEYKKLASSVSNRSKLGRDMIWAFIIGGLICCLGQILVDVYMNLGMNKINAGTLSSVTLILLSALLTGLNLYDKIAKVGGAGTLVPITGFANAVASPALEFKTEGYVLGVAAKMFVIAGPVIVYGVVSSVIYGIILALFGA